MPPLRAHRGERPGTLKGATLLAQNQTTRNPQPLFYASPETSTDLLYFGGFLAPDPFLAFESGKQRVAVLNALEYARALKESRFDTVLSLEEWREKARRRYGTSSKAVKLAQIVRLLWQEFSIHQFVVPHDFPAGLAFELKRAKVPFTVSSDELFPQRAIKTTDEVKELREANNAAAAGIRTAEQLLRRATIGKGDQLFYQRKMLTSERLREAIAVACLIAGGSAPEPIAAGGEQACDPHAKGTGPLYANQLIIVDVFPRITRTGYYGDMTRTFLKGRASEAQRKLVAVVRQAQEQALTQMKIGCSTARIHASVVKFFNSRGYHTKCKDGISQGFFHSTGHGIGLDIHEAPRVGPNGGRLRKGMVITVEPGLYYSNIGGVRIEDVVHVTTEGPKKLSDFHYQWEIA